MDAVTANDTEALNYFRRHKKIDEKINSNGETWLMYASRNCSPEHVGTLLESGANPNKADGNGFTPLLLAAMGNDKTCEQTTQTLLASGADVNKANKDGWTPLMMAVRLNRLETTKALLAAGADIHAVDGNGNSALLHAVLWNHPKGVKLLLDNGANPNTENNGVTALMAAQKRGFTKVAKLLKQAGAQK
jgi:ankyrin repeat protein